MTLDQLSPSQREELEAAEMRYAPLTMQVLTAVFLSKAPISPTELRDITGIDRNAVSTALSRLIKGEMIERTSRARYRMHRSMHPHSEKFFLLQCEDPSL